MRKEFERPILSLQVGRNKEEFALKPQVSFISCDLLRFLKLRTVGYFVGLLESYLETKKALKG